MPMPTHGNGPDELSQHYNPILEAITLWDIAERPVTNDWLTKLGRGLSAIGQAVASKDGDHAVLFSDIVKNSVVSRRPFDPDNWALRVRDASGRGVRSSWAIRDICDHSNPHYQRLHNSTMVIDQAATQLWAWRSDLEWIAELGTSNGHNELGFNGAGFLQMLYDGIGTPGSRGALSINMAHNAGYITDGVYVGQLGHVLRFLPGSSGGTVVAGRPSTKVNLGLRGDVLHDYGNFNGIWWPTGKDIPPKKEESGKLYLVEFVAGPVFPEKGQDPTTDALSNHEPIAREDGKLILGVVKIPTSTPTVPPKHQYPPTQTQPGGHTPNPYAAPTPTGEAGGRPPVPTVDTTHGPTSQAHCFLPGEFSGIMVKFPIPSDLGSSGSPTWMEITMEFSVRAAHSGVQTSDVSFMYRSVAQGATPGSYTQVDKSFAVADGLAAGKWTHCRLTVPRSALVGAENGILELWTYMRSSSTGPQLILGEFHNAYKFYGTAPAGGFAIL